MKITIFTRLIIGYLIIFILLITVNAYAILKLHQFNIGTGYVLSIHNRLIDYKKKLIDSILSQRRYGKEYVVTKNIFLYNQFVSAKSEFDKYFGEARLIADTPPKMGSLDRIKANYERYQSLIEKEVKFVRGDQRYDNKWYEQEKEKASDGILKELETLEDYSWQDISNRMKILGKLGVSARNIDIVMAMVAIVLVIVTSFFITRNITKPLTLLMNKTKEVSEGVFRDDLNFPSPPEISEVMKAFNSMCDRLKAVDKMKSDFFSTMSHELRTPLTSIKEGTNLLLEGVSGELKEKQIKILTIISEESNRLIVLVNSLLDLSKMEAGMMTYNIEPTHLRPLIDQAINEINPLAETKKISLETEINGNLPMIKIDCERILQVLRNLIGNAVKFTPDGGRVRVLAKPVDRGVEVSVADTGPGIPLENLTTIFDKFEQVITVGPYRTKGTGLGLAIVNHIIESHGGKVWAESKPGQGSRFIFVLPA
jgi:two-component system sensor histidine kinase GlrK